MVLVQSQTDYNPTVYHSQTRRNGTLLLPSSSHRINHIQSLSFHFPPRPWTIWWTWERSKVCLLDTVMNVQNRIKYKRWTCKIIKLLQDSVVQYGVRSGISRFPDDFRIYFQCRERVDVVNLFQSSKPTKRTFLKKRSSCTLNKYLMI